MKVTVEALMNYLRGLPPEAPVMLGIQSENEQGDVYVEYQQIDDIIYSVKQGHVFIHSTYDAEE